MKLSAQVRDFLAAPRYATIATLNADGSVHQTVVWYLLRDDHLVLNSKVGRRWPTNLLRDARLSMTVEDGLDYVTLEGVAEPLDDQAQAQADIAEMAQRYDPPDAAARAIAEFRRQQRISFQLRPQTMHTHGGLS